MNKNVNTYGNSKDKSLVHSDIVRIATHGSCSGRITRPISVVGVDESAFAVVLVTTLATRASTAAANLSATADLVSHREALNVTADMLHNARDLVAYH